jgi:hypothetical protein
VFVWVRTGAQADIRDLSDLTGIARAIDIINILRAS